MAEPTPNYTRSIRVAPLAGALILAPALTVYQFTIPFVTVNGLLFSAVVNFVIYYFVCWLIAWIYRKAKWPPNREMIVVLAFPLVTSVCAVIQFVSATATAIAK